MTTPKLRWYQRAIRWLYIRFVWAPAESVPFTPELQLTQMLSNHFGQHASFDADMEMNGPCRQFFENLLRVTLDACKNYREMTWHVQLAGDEKTAPTQHLITVQKCEGKTPHALRMEAEAKARARRDVIHHFYLYGSYRGGAPEKLTTAQAKVMEECVQEWRQEYDPEFAAECTAQNEDHSQPKDTERTGRQYASVEEMKKAHEGHFCEKRCPKCNCSLLRNSLGDEWCSFIECDFGIEEQTAPSETQLSPG